MEKYLLIAILILLVSLTISFIVVIADYAEFKKRIERILDLNIETNNDNKELINLTDKVNKSVGRICELNGKLYELNNSLITNIRHLVEENNFLRNKIEHKEETNEE